MKKPEFRVVEIRDASHSYTCYTGTFSQCSKEREAILKAQLEEMEEKPYYSRDYRDKNDNPFKYEIAMNR